MLFNWIQVKEKASKYIIDFENVSYYKELHETIRDSLEFPAYYGRNWDALWDCLQEIVNLPTHMQIKNLEALQERGFAEEVQMFIDILKEFKHYGNDKYSDRTFIEIIDQNGNVTVLEWKVHLPTCKSHKAKNLSNSNKNDHRQIFVENPM